jgi:protein-tyrosine-phosphatase
MSDHPKRVLFLCAKRSVRALMAASLLAAHTEQPWDIWIAPGAFSSEEVTLVHQVLAEKGIPVLASPQTTEPSFDRSWEEGIVLCSGATDQ